VTAPGHSSEQLIALGLGLLEPEEARAVDAHLAGCEACRREWDELRATSALLEAVPKGAIPPEMFLDGPPDADRPGEFGLLRALRQVRGERRAIRHRQRMFRAAAAAVLVVAVGGAGVLAGRLSAPESEPAPAPPIAAGAPGRLLESASGAVTATAVLTPANGWVRVAVTAGGIPAGKRCTVVVVGRDGTESVAANWIEAGHPSGGTTTVNGSAGIAPDDVAAVLVRDDGNTVLVSLPA
jgi:hypothetical protein